jgi:hypothetical protein
MNSCLDLDWRMQTRSHLRFGLYFDWEILAQLSPRWGVVFCIQSSFKFVRYLLLTSTRNTIFTKFSSFLTKFVSTGKCEKYRFHGESSQNVRDHAFCSSRFFPKVARPLRVPLRVTPCGRMPARCPRAPAICPGRLPVAGFATSACLSLRPRRMTQTKPVSRLCPADILVTTDRSV